MSDVSGYLQPQKPGVVAPVNTNAQPLLVTDGWVLNGEESAAERIYKDSVEALESARLEGGALPRGLVQTRPQDRGFDEFYPSVDDYDPVLAWHCRL